MSEYFKEGDVVKFKEVNVSFIDLSAGLHYEVKSDFYGDLYIDDNVGDKRYVFLQDGEYMELVNAPVDNASIKQKLAQIETLLTEVKLALG